ncbi:hypothetical protein, partial [Staphylococcus haemolyticus]|uniref:hypothetical protein n=1 Tax=Staphylococcus haemolyticus TaxID=1283 RepID=UPI0015D7C417
ADYLYLKQHFAGKFLAVVGLMSLLMIPLFISLRYVQDKTALDSALDYIYAPADGGEKSVNVPALTRALSTIDEHKGRRNNFGFATGTPYLSSYYRWLVLDNLTLSDEKLSTLLSVFTGVGDWSTRAPIFRDNDLVELTEATVESTWDPKQEAWISWVDLKLTQASNTQGRGEYKTLFEL